MSIINLFGKNDYTLYSKNLFTDKIDANTVGGRIDLGIVGTNVYIEGLPYNPSSGDLVMNAIGGTPNANGGTAALNHLTLQPANTTYGGIVTTAGQSFSGQKNFPDAISINTASIDVNTSNVLNHYYKSTNNIACTWDPTPLLFAAPQNSSIKCERIGDMIFIKVRTISAFPVGQATLRSQPGIVPAEFRPAAMQYTSALVMNGYVDATPVIQRPSPFNSWLGACTLDTDGSLVFGTSKDPVAGPITTDVSQQLVEFQGPNLCGFYTQTLIFSAV